MRPQRMAYFCMCYALWASLDVHFSRVEVWLFLKPSIFLGFSINMFESSILIGFSIINHPFLGAPILGNTQVVVSFLFFMFTPTWGNDPS